MEKLSLEIQESSLFMRRKIAASLSQEGNSNSSSPHGILPQPVPQKLVASSHHIKTHPAPLQHVSSSQHVTPMPLPQHHFASSHHIPLHHTSTFNHIPPHHTTSSQKIPLHKTTSSPTPNHPPSRPQHLPLKNIASPHPLHPIPLHMHESSYGVPLKSSESSPTNLIDEIMREFPPPPKGTPPPKPPRRLKFPSTNPAIKESHLRNEVKDQFLANLDYDQAMNDCPPAFTPPPCDSKKEFE